MTPVPPCPHCGVSMWIEMNGTLIKHPTNTGCQLDGRAFRREKRNEKDIRPTWAAYAARYGGEKTPEPAQAAPMQSGPAPTPPAPQAAPAAPQMPSLNNATETAD